MLVQGLHRLEYRGYDSAGVAIVKEDGTLNVCKAKGKVANLEEKAAWRMWRDASALPTPDGLRTANLTT